MSVSLTWLSSAPTAVATTIIEIRPIQVSAGRTATAHSTPNGPIQEGKGREAKGREGKRGGKRGIKMKPQHQVMAIHGVPQRVGHHQSKRGIFFRIDRMSIDNGQWG